MKDRAMPRRPHRGSLGPRSRRTLPYAPCLVLLTLCGGLLGACSLAVPMNGTPDEAPTGSIKHAANLFPFSAEMDAEDWRRAKSALDTALDPQGNGASVAWDNPTSGARGSFVPLSQPYPKDDGICRPFAAHLNVKGEPERIAHSSACRVNSGEWVIGRIVPDTTTLPRSKQ